jgi:hypothetical protein
MVQAAPRAPRATIPATPDADLWAPGAGNGREPDAREPGHGSNVDLGVECEEIKAELRRLSRLLDAARGAVAAASCEIPDIRRDLREQRDLAWRALDSQGSVLARHGVTVARERVAAQCRELTHQLETAEALEARGRHDCEVIGKQISATQTLANLWIKQWDEEKR